GSAPGGAVWIRSVEARVAAAVPAAAAARPPAAREAGAVVYAFDAGALKPGRYTVENRQTNGENFFPDSFFGHCWKAESVSEFRCEEVAGSRAFGVTNFNDTLSSQVLVYVENLAPLVAGKEYLLRVEY